MTSGLPAETRARAEQLLEQLRQYEAKGRNLSDQEFHTAVKSIIDLGIATDRKLGMRFKVSLPTIGRWQYKSAPHPLGRKSVIAGLIEEVEAFLA